MVVRGDHIDSGLKIHNSGKTQGSSCSIIHKMRANRLMKFIFQKDLTDEELQDYILYDKIKKEK